MDRHQTSRSGRLDWRVLFPRSEWPWEHAENIGQSIERCHFVCKLHVHRPDPALDRYLNFEAVECAARVTTHLAERQEVPFVVEKLSRVEECNGLDSRKVFLTRSSLAC